MKKQEEKQMCVIQASQKKHFKWSKEESENETKNTSAILYPIQLFMGYISALIKNI